MNRLKEWTLKKCEDYLKKNKRWPIDSLVKPLTIVREPRTRIVKATAKYSLFEKNHIEQTVGKGIFENHLKETLVKEIIHQLLENEYIIFNEVAGEDLMSNTIVAGLKVYDPRCDTATIDDKIYENKLI